MAEHSVWTFTRDDMPRLRDQLAIVPTGAPDMPRYTRDAYVAHNGAVSDWVKSNIGAMNNGRQDERVILDMLAAVEAWLACHDPEPGYYVAENILTPMLEAIGDMLNFECGRLDRGVLDHWRQLTYRRAGIPESARS